MAEKEATNEDDEKALFKRTLSSFKTPHRPRVPPPFVSDPSTHQGILSNSKHSNKTPRGAGGGHNTGGLPAGRSIYRSSRQGAVGRSRTGPSGRSLHRGRSMSQGTTDDLSPGIKNDHGPKFVSNSETALQDGSQGTTDDLSPGIKNDHGPKFVSNFETALQARSRDQGMDTTTMKTDLSHTNFETAIQTNMKYPDDSDPDSIIPNANDDDYLNFESELQQGSAYPNMGTTMETDLSGVNFESEMLKNGNGFSNYGSSSETGVHGGNGGGIGITNNKFSNND